MSGEARSTAWLAGLVLGVVAGFVALELPTLGIVFLVLALVLLGRRAPRRAGVGGLALGFGSLWVVVLAHAWFECATGTWHGCTGSSSADGFLVAGVVILLLGVLLTWIAGRGTQR